VWRCDYGAHFAVAQDVNDIVVAKLDIQRDRDTTRAQNPESGRQPFWTLFCEQGEGIAALKASLAQPVGEGSRTLRQFPIGPSILIFLCEGEQRGSLAIRT
jgi:hypothetical protein